MRPRAESRVCKMEFNWLRSWARSWAFSDSACAAAWRAFSVSASAARCCACAAARSLAAWSAAACADCCCAKAAALAFSASAFWRAASAAACWASCCMRRASALAASACWRASSAALRLFLGLLFYGHDAGFFRSLHHFARSGDDGFFVALAGVNVLGIPELLLGLGKRGSGVPVGKRDMRDADGVARFKKLERSLAVDAEDGVFNFGVGRGVAAAADKFVASVDVFDFAERGRTKDVFEDDRVAGLRDGEIRLGSDDHAKGLHVRDGFDFAAA